MFHKSHLIKRIKTNRSGARLERLLQTSTPPPFDPLPRGRGCDGVGNGAVRKTEGGLVICMKDLQFFQPDCRIYRYFPPLA